MNSKQNNPLWHQSILAFLLLGLVACSNSYLGKSLDQVTPAPTLRSTRGPTLAKSATPTQLPSATKASPAQTNTPMPSLQGPFVAFAATEATGKDYALILDLGTGLVRKLSWNSHTPMQSKWRSDGCELDVTVATASSIELISTDLSNQRSETIFSGGRRSDGGFLTWPVVDPEGKWIAYTVLSGEQTYAGAEFQNIEVVAIGNPASPSVLTTHGGASKAAWSPNDERLSYSDYDAAGVNQLYVARPDGKEKSQLTHFTVTGTIISTIQWSPIGNAIAFATRDNNRLGSLWIVATDGSKLTKATTKDASESVEKIWWSEDGQIITAYMRSASGEAHKDAVYWINPADGRILRTLEASDTPDKYISQPLPVGGVQVVGFVGDKRIIFYDMKTGRFEEKQYAIDWADLTGPAQASPATFQGEAACTTP